MSIWSEEYTKETWFGDPNLQGVWTNASLTTLERPDYFESLEISDDAAMTARQSSEEFNQTLDTLSNRAIDKQQTNCPSSEW